MTHPADKTYLFKHEEHWRAGAVDGFAIGDDGLAALPRFDFAPVPDTNPEDRDALPACDACGRLVWLRPRTGLLLRRYPFGVEEAGVLTYAEGARAMVLACGVIWVLTADSLHRYDAATLQHLGSVVPEPQTAILAIAADGHGGLWLLKRQAPGAGILRHVDCWGRPCPETVPLARPLDKAFMAASRDGRTILIADPSSEADEGSCPPHYRWRLLIIDACGNEEPREPLHNSPGVLGPLGPISIDEADNLHVFFAGSPAAIETFSLEGERVARRRIVLPAGWAPATAMATCGDGLVLSGNGGLGSLSDDPAAAGGGTDLVSSFITPTLISPTGVRSGWNRADIDAVLPKGTTLEVTIASTSAAGEIAAVEAIFEDTSLSPSDRFEMLQSRLSWREAEKVTYTSGTSGPSGEAQEEPAGERFRYLLDRTTDSHLWMRLQFYAPPRRKPPALQELRVYYPNRSYIEDLPAIYREEPFAAAQLRRMLSPLEALFEDLEDEITAIPTRSDPEAAPDSATAFLLNWLGFPLLEDLKAELRRDLLAAAPALLGMRGTRQALEQVLDIATGGRASVEDSAAGSTGWFLPAMGAAGPRLGRDTLVAGQQPPPFRAGGSGLLGQTPLGPGCADPELIVAQRIASIVIRIEIGPEERETLEPIIDRLLAIFVPAHCRVRIDYTGADGHWRARRLDGELRLAGDDTHDTDSRLGGYDQWRIGATTALGAWRLPAAPCHGAVLNKTSRLDRAALT